MHQDELLPACFQPDPGNQIQLSALATRYVGEMLLAKKLNLAEVDPFRLGRTEQLQELAKKRFNQLLEDLIVVDGHWQGSGGRSQESGVRRNGSGLLIIAPSIRPISAHLAVRSECCSGVM